MTAEELKAAILAGRKRYDELEQQYKALDQEMYDLSSEVMDLEDQLASLIENPPTINTWEKVRAFLED